MLPILDLDAAVAAVRAGGLVAIPTETVYGLAARATNPAAVSRIFKAKGRPAKNPLICHLADAESVFRYGRRSPAAERLAELFWPGPLTLLLPHAGRIDRVITAGSPLAGFRVPAHPLTREFLAALDEPIAAPSANRSGRRSPTSAAMVQAEDNPEYLRHVQGVLDGGAATVGLESTVLALVRESPPDSPESTGATVRILRPGGLTAEQLHAAGFAVEFDPAQAAPAGSADSASSLQTDDRYLHAPGRLLSHYAPGVPLLLIPRRDDPLTASEAPELLHDSLQTALANFGDQDAHLNQGVTGRIYWLGFAGRPAPAARSARIGGSLDLAPDGDMAAAARRLFAAFEELRLAGATAIICEELPETGLGAAINDRLRRAAAVKLG